MANTEPKTCQMQMHGGKPCGRPVYDDEKCIGHSERTDKDIELFNKEVERILSDAGCYCHDFIGFVFPLGEFKLTGTFEKEVYYSDCKFFGNVRFNNSQFHRLADFEAAEFRGGVSFSNAVFVDFAYFNKTEFLHASFEGAEFRKDVTFNEARFEGETDFNQTTFLGKIDLRESSFEATASFVETKFSGNMNFRDVSFLSDTNFELATFAEEAGFYSTRFHGATDFVGAKFSKGACFMYTAFSGNVNFLGARFVRGGYFRDVRFSEKTNFEWATFSQQTSFESTQFEKGVSFSFCIADRDASLTFDGESLQKENKEMFLAPAEFIGCSVTEPKNIKFRKVSLDKCAFLETDVRDVQFIDVTWDTMPKFIPRWMGRIIRRWTPKFHKWLPRRNAAYDEVSIKEKWFKWLRLKIKREQEPPKPEYKLIAMLYRRLQANYINNLSYAEAGDFYVGEQEMVRKGKGSGWTIWRRWVCTNFIYKCLSYYGESFLLPLVWLAVVLLGFPVYLLREGTDIATYPQALWTNLTFITFNRTAISTSLPLPYQQGIVAIENIVIVVLVTFFVLALRRRYKRKGF